MEDEAYTEEDRSHEEAEVPVNTWEDFWHKATTENAQAMRDAGVDPNAPFKLSKNKHGQEIKAGMPTDNKVLCFGCGKPVSLRYECCQCLEIFRDRALCTAFDDWERSFWCSGECYKEHWEGHKHRHGPSKSGPSKLDSRIHEFVAAKGYGALWDSSEVKRLNYVKCVPIW